MTSSGWSAPDAGSTCGTAGSEGGIIVLDDEHDDGARITIERGGSTAPYAITCGIYGWMFHTRFCATEAEARADVDKMKVEIGAILALISEGGGPDDDAASRAVVNAIQRLVETFP